MCFVGVKEFVGYQVDFDVKNQELFCKEEVLWVLEVEIVSKEKLFVECENCVVELEEVFFWKDDVIKVLKIKVLVVFKGFENKGLIVVEKNGKIYVSLEVKLLFVFGSIVVEVEGKLVLV